MSHVGRDKWAWCFQFIAIKTGTVLLESNLALYGGKPMKYSYYLIY